MLSDFNCLLLVQHNTESLNCYKALFLSLKVKYAHKKLTFLSLVYRSSGVSSHSSLVLLPRRPVNSQSNDTRQHLDNKEEIS